MLSAHEQNKVTITPYSSEGIIPLGLSMYWMFADPINQDSVALDFPGTVAGNTINRQRSVLAAVANKRRIQSQLEEHKVNPFRAYTIKLGSRRVGVCTLAWTDTTPYAETQGDLGVEGSSMGLWLDHDYRGQGIGQIALAFRIDVVRNDKIYDGKLWAHVRDDNNASKINLEKAGFTVVSSGDHTIGQKRMQYGQIYTLDTRA